MEVKKGLGIESENGTANIQNTNLEVTDNGRGILAINSVITLKNDDVNNKNNKLKVTKGIGIQLENSIANIENASMEVQKGLGIESENGTITIKKSNLSVRDGKGIYLKNSTANIFDSKLAVNTNGIGFFAIDSEIQLHNTKLTIAGKNSTGMILAEGSKVFIDKDSILSIRWRDAKAGLLEAGSEYVCKAKIEGTRKKIWSKIKKLTDLSPDANPIGKKEKIPENVIIPGNITNAGSIESDIPIVLQNTKLDITKIHNPLSFRTPSLAGRGVVLPNFTQGNKATQKNFKISITQKKGNKTPSLSRNFDISSKSYTWHSNVELVTQNEKKHETIVEVAINKINYAKLIDDVSAYQSLAEGLDTLYTAAPTSTPTGKVFDAIDMIDNKADFDRQIAELRGDLYANIQDRVDDINHVFERGDRFLATQAPLSSHTYKMALLGEHNSHGDNQARSTWDVNHVGVLITDQRDLRSRPGRQIYGEMGYLFSNFNFDNEANNKAKEKVHTIRLGLGYNEPLWHTDNNELDLKLSTHINAGRHRVNRTISTSKTLFENFNTLYAYDWTTDLGLQYKHHWSSFTVQGKVGVVGQYLRISSGDETGAVPLDFNGKNYNDLLPYIELQGLTSHRLDANWNLQAKLGARVAYSTKKPFDARNRVTLLGTSQTYELPGTVSHTSNTTFEAQVLLAQRKGFSISLLGSLDTEKDHSLGIQTGFKW